MASESRPSSRRGGCRRGRGRSSHEASRCGSVPREPVDAYEHALHAADAYPHRNLMSDTSECSPAQSAQTAVVLVIWKKIRSYDGRARLHTGRGTQDLELHGPGLSILCIVRPSPTYEVTRSCSSRASNFDLADMTKRGEP